MDTEEMQKQKQLEINTEETRYKEQEGNEQEINVQEMKQKTEVQEPKIGFWKKAWNAVRQFFYTGKQTIEQSASSQLNETKSEEKKSSGTRYTCWGKIKMWFESKEKREDRKFLTDYKEDVMYLLNVGDLETMAPPKSNGPKVLDRVYREKFPMLGEKEEAFQHAVDDICTGENKEESQKTFIEGLKTAKEKIREIEDFPGALYFEIRSSNKRSFEKKISYDFLETNLERVKDWYGMCYDTDRAFANLSEKKEVKEIHDKLQDIQKGLKLFLNTIQVKAWKQVKPEANGSCSHTRTQLSTDLKSGIPDFLKKEEQKILDEVYVASERDILASEEILKRLDDARSFRAMLTEENLEANDTLATELLSEQIEENISGMEKLCKKIMAWDMKEFSLNFKETEEKRILLNKTMLKYNYFIAEFGNCLKCYRPEQLENMKNESEYLKAYLDECKNRTNYLQEVPQGIYISKYSTIRRIEKREDLDEASRTRIEEEILGNHRESVEKTKEKYQTFSGKITYESWKKAPKESF